jgi:hypothetical protein
VNPELRHVDGHGVPLRVERVPVTDDSPHPPLVFEAVDVERPLVTIRLGEGGLVVVERER